MADALLGWYHAHQRDLPWRRVPDAYATWISEVMLQQTQVQAVIPYFERWMKRFPTLVTLAEAPEDAVLGAWQGLGYYSRARNLQRSARQIVERFNGVIPSDPKRLRELPGIGRYTAGAIASIAFGQPEPAVDGNVMRVVTRLEAWHGDPRSQALGTRIGQHLASWLEHTEPSQFNQALMELGALVCSPDSPRCVHCPLLRYCHGRRLGIAEALPEHRARATRETRQIAIIVATRGRALFVLQQPEAARHWAKLYTLPYVEVAARETPNAAAKRLLRGIDPKARLLAEDSAVRIVYPITRFRFEATAYRVTALRPTCATAVGGRFASLTELRELAMPAPHRRLVERILE